MSSYVTIMHNGRIFKEGAPSEIEDDEEVQAIIWGGPWIAPALAKPKAVLQVKELKVYYGASHAPGRRSEARARRPFGRRPQRHGQDDALQGDRRAHARPAGSIRFNGLELIGLEPHRDRPRGVGYVPQGRRLWPSLTVDETCA